MTCQQCPIIFAALASLLATPLSAQWTYTGTGPALVDTAACFDDLRGVVVAFGGAGATPSLLGGGFEYDGTGWASIAAAGPTNRASSVLAFMDHLGVSVLFGGLTATSILADTWHWNGTAWTQNPTPGPSPRYNHAMVYDSDRSVVVLYGGEFSSGGTGQIYNDTWEYDGSTWTQRSAFGPSFRSGHAMAYDAHRHRTVLYGGGLQQNSHTWEWDGSAWNLQGNIGPGFRRRHAMSYNPIRKRVLLFSGNILNGMVGQDQYEWNGTTWTSLGGSAPPGRLGHAMVYDSQRLVTVMFGGSGVFTPPPGDTWERATTGSFEPFGAGCLGTPPLPFACYERNPSGGTLTGTTAPVEFACLASTASTSVTGFEIYTRSTGGVVTVPAHIYQYPGTTPIASTTITIGATPAFYSATFPTPVTASGALLLAIDASAQNVVMPNLTSGTFSGVFTRQGGAWSLLSSQRPGLVLHCQSVTTPYIGHVGNPTIGASYQVTLDSVPTSIGVLLTGHSAQSYLGQPLPWTLPGTPSCDLLVSADLTHGPVSTASGAAATTIQVPPGLHLVGSELFHQWAILDPSNSLGLITSNAAAVVVGN